MTTALDNVSQDFYNKALDLAQKALFSGITVSAVAYLVAISEMGKTIYSIPIIGIEVKTAKNFAISIIFLYMACGLLCSYSMNKAIKNWELISDRALANRLLESPNLLLSGIFYKAVIYGGLYSVSCSLVNQAFALYDWKAMIAGSVVSTPYFLSIRATAHIRKQKPEANITKQAKT